MQVRRVQVNSTEAVYKWPCGYIKTIKKTNKSKGCIKNKSASLDDVQMQFRRKKKRKKLMADKCTSFLDLLSFPFTSLVCKSLFIFPVF